MKVKVTVTKVCLLSEAISFVLSDLSVCPSRVCLTFLPMTPGGRHMMSRYRDLINGWISLFSGGISPTLLHVGLDIFLKIIVQSLM